MAKVLRMPKFMETSFFAEIIFIMAIYDRIGLQDHKPCGENSGEEVPKPFFDSGGQGCHIILHSWVSLSGLHIHLFTNRSHIPPFAGGVAGPVNSPSGWPTYGSTLVFQEHGCTPENRQASQGVNYARAVLPGKKLAGLGG